MVFSFLFMTIGLVPVLLGMSMLRLYGKSKLTGSLFIYMGSIAIWQFAVALLYMVAPWLAMEWTLFLERAFRIGVISGLPLMIYIGTSVFENNTVKQKSIKEWFMSKVFNKQVLIGSIMMSLIVYGIGWTSWGFTGLELRVNESMNFSYYAPIYGSLNWTLKVQVFLYFVYTVLLFYVVRDIVNKQLRSFLYSFVVASFLLYVMGITNFNSSFNFTLSSIAVLLYSIFIMFSFVKMQNRLSKQYVEAMEKNNKLDYVGNMSASLLHEVKNYLSVIKGNAEVMPMVSNLDESGARLLNQLHMASSQLTELVQTYNEFLSNDKEVEGTEEDILVSIEKAKMLVLERKEEENVRVNVISTEKSVILNMDDTYMTQVFVNLIKNGIEAIPANREEKRIDIFVESFERSVVIDVQDTGRGIAKDNWERVFTPYNSDRKGGTGLGLPFSRKVIKAHGGNISIVSSSVDGTHMRIVLQKNRKSMGSREMQVT